MKTHSKTLSIFLSITLLFSIILPFQFVSAANEETVTITILGTTDIHGNIYDWSYEDKKEDDDVGLAKVFTIVKQVRAENPNTILIDNGDILQGTVLADDLYNNNLEEPNPMIDVMNFMGYDAMTLGNHEFNFGLELINKAVDEADFSILSANTYKKEDGSNFVKPYVVKEIAGIKVGILGLTTPNIPLWDGPKVTTLEFKHMADEAEKYAKILKDEEGVDLIIASIHAGLEGRHHPDEGDAAKHVIDRVPDIKAVLLGHDHIEIAEEVNGTLVGAADDKGNQVVRFDLTLQKQDDSWTVTDNSVKLIETKEVIASEDVKDYAAKYHEKTLEFLKIILGTSTGNFHPESEVPGIPEAQIKDTAVIDLINEVQLKYTGADVSAAALFKPSSNISKGPVTYSDIFDIYKYPNTLYAVEVTGKELKDYMEWSASYYNTYKPGDITISFNPKIRGYNYDMFAGVEYKVDISKPAGSRIVDLTFKGQPLKDDQILKLAVNNYRFGSTLQGKGIISNEAYFKSDPVSIRSYIAEYIKDKGTLYPEVDNNWEIIGANLEHWAKNDAYDLIRTGVIEIPVSEDGRTPNVESLNMNKKVTRGEFIKKLVRALKLKLPEITSTQFTDVDEKLAPYVQAALNAYITQGIAGDYFGADEVITREQAVTLLVRSLHVPLDEDLSIYNFIDIDQVSSWAKASMGKALKIGLVDGTTPETISPKKELKYSHMVAFLQKYLKNYKDFGIREIDIFATNDFHGALEGGYEAGIAKMASVFDEYKMENPKGTIILDAGDRFQGTPLSNVFFGKPVIEAFNEIGYSAATIGNHEFDWGIDKVLEKRQEAEAAYPILAANIYDKSTNKLAEWVEPYTIIEQNGVKIGIIGLVTPDTLETAKLEFIKDYDFKDPIELTNTLVPEVREAGADLVILLTHIPAYQDRDTKKITGPLAELANGVNAVDGIIGGHSHQAVSGVINGIPVVEGYKNGRMLSHLTIYYDIDNNEVVNSYVDVAEVRKTPLPVEPDKEILAIVDIYNLDVKPIFDEVIGTTVELTRDYNNESNVGNWMTDLMKEKAMTQIAFQNAGGIRTDLPAGDLTVGGIFKVMPFDNTIVKAEMTGSQIISVLEQSVTLYKGMMQVSGLMVKYDSSKPEYERIIEITLEDGTPLEMDKTYTVATNDFLSDGQDGFKTLGEVDWTNTYELVRESMIEKIKEVKDIAPAVEGRMIDVSVEVTIDLLNAA